MTDTDPTTPSPECQPADAGGGLLPCPMCEGPGHLQHTVQQLDDGWHVICHGKKDCPLFCSTPYRLHDTKAEARAAWNRRNPVPQAQPDWNYEGAMSDLDSAISVLIKRINGEADLASAAEWVRLNYPKRAGEIKAQPDARAAEAPAYVGMSYETRGPAADAERRRMIEDRYPTASAPAADDGWRPIESAPKDGTKFSSQDRGNYGRRVFNNTYWYVHPSVAGWITDDLDCGDYEFEPTHWKPAAPRRTLHE